MHPHLRDRIVRKLDTLTDERGYQVLDYIEFLESKYAERQEPANIFTRFTEGLEDTLRAGKVSTTAIAETMSLMNRAMGVLSGVAAAGKSVASDIVSAASAATSGVAAKGTGTTGTAGESNQSAPAPETRPEGSSDRSGAPPTP